VNTNFLNLIWYNFYDYMQHTPSNCEEDALTTIPLRWHVDVVVRSFDSNEIF